MKSFGRIFCSNIQLAEFPQRHGDAVEEQSSVSLPCSIIKPNFHIGTNLKEHVAKSWIGR